MKKMAILGFVLAMFALVAMPTADAQIIEEESFYQYCWYVCDKVNGVWSCQPSNLEYCCWECIEYQDSCSDGWIYDACPECVGSGSAGV